MCAFRTCAYLLDTAGLTILGTTCIICTVLFKISNTQKMRLAFFDSYIVDNKRNVQNLYVAIL